MATENLNEALPANDAFLAGRDLACEALARARTVGGDTASIEAQYRDGRPQDNWVREYLHVLVGKPELVEGFAAVLSDYLTTGGITDVEVYQRLSERDMFGVH